MAAASHELRTPLSVILSSLECCHQASPDEVAGFLATIEKQAALMKSLVNDLLTLSASDSGQLVLSRSTAELDTLLLDTFEAFEPLAARKSITMSVSLPEEALTPYSCDEMRIRQVLSILIQNAISYTPAGGHIHLALSVRIISIFSLWPITVLALPMLTKNIFLSAFTGLKNPGIPKAISVLGFRSPVKS